MRRFGRLIAIVLIIFLNGCATSSTSVPSKPGFVANDGIYISLEYPISLHPAITSGLNLGEKDKGLGYDRNLLALSSSISKMNTDQLNVSGSISASVANGNADVKRYKSTYDTILYSSFPLKIEVPINDKNNCRASNTCQTQTMNILPLIGAGVRVVAEYDSDSYSAGLSLAYLSANASKSQINGNVQLQLLGVNRLGPNASGFTQLNLTPDSISMVQQQIGVMMSQMWNKDTIIQPKIIGYSIIGAPDLANISQSDVMEQLLSKVHFLSNYFFETLLQESIKRGDVDPNEADSKRNTFVVDLARMSDIDNNILVTKVINSRLKNFNADPKILKSDKFISSVSSHYSKSLDNLDITTIDNTIKDAIKGIGAGKTNNP